MSQEEGGATRFEMPKLAKACFMGFGGSLDCQKATMAKHVATGTKFDSKHALALLWAEKTEWFKQQGVVAPPAPISTKTTSSTMNDSWKRRVAKNYGALLMRIVCHVWIAVNLVPMLKMSWKIPMFVNL